MKRLDEIEARWAKATPGPWEQVKQSEPHTGVNVISRTPRPPCDFTPIVSFHAIDPAENRDAIAHAPEDIAYLIAEVRRYEAIAREAERRGMERAAGVCEEWASKAVLNHGARWSVGRCVERIRSLIADDTEKSE